jgi:hypothetical protein
MSKRMFRRATSDRHERYLIKDAIERIELMKKLGRYGTSDFYGRESRWKERSANIMIEQYKARLRELDHIAPR